MPKPFFARHRIKLTYIFSALVIAFLLFSSNAEEPEGMLSAFLFSSGTILIGLATVGRIWCLLYIAGYKKKVLITQGPYSLCRNPLYFFSMLGFVGLGLSTETFTLAIVSIVVFALYYPYIIRTEERVLLNEHNDAYREYLERVPSFFPSFKNYREPEEYVVRPIVFRRRLFDALLFVWGIGLLEFIESLHETGLVPVYFHLH